MNEIISQGMNIIIILISVLLPIVIIWKGNKYSNFLNRHYNVKEKSSEVKKA